MRKKIEAIDMTNRLPQRSANEPQIEPKIAPGKQNGKKRRRVERIE